MIARVCRCTASAALASLIAFIVMGCERTDYSEAATPIAEREPVRASMSTRLDACVLLSKEEAEQALGESINPPINQVVSEGGADRAAISQCRYQSASSPGKMLAVFLRRSPVADNRPDSVRDTLTQSGVTSEDVSSVGDHAFWAAEQLHVFAKDNLYLIVTVSGLADAKQHATSIAQRALERA